MCICMYKGKSSTKNSLYNRSLLCVRDSERFHHVLQNGEKTTCVLVVPGVFHLPVSKLFDHGDLSLGYEASGNRYFICVHLLCI